MARPSKERVLTERDQADIRSYCAAHHWIGHRSAIAKKYGVGMRTIASVVKGNYFRQLILVDMVPAQSENRTHESSR